MNPERAWIIATRVALWVVAALFVILLATGVALSFRYRPDVTFGTHPAPAARFTARSIHRLASTLFVLAVGALAVSSIGLLLVRRRRWNAVVPVFTAIAAAVASFTGYLLPWDQLGLRAVTVGTDIRGYRSIISGNRVQFVLMGNREMTKATLRSWFWVHTLALPVVLIAAILGVAFTARRARSS